MKDLIETLADLMEAEPHGLPSKHLGGGKYEYKGKKGVWRTLGNRDRGFFPDDGSEPMGMERTKRHGGKAKAGPDYGLGSREASKKYSSSRAGTSSLQKQIREMDDGRFDKLQRVGGYNLDAIKGSEYYDEDDPDMALSVLKDARARFAERARVADTEYGDEKANQRAVKRDYHKFRAWEKDSLGKKADTLQVYVHNRAEVFVAAMQTIDLIDHEIDQILQGEKYKGGHSGTSLL